ncbi:MAG: hypothetical protein COA44_10550 [Arcobacter sp.]|nr:MAG: hypothetical protein COA44_10550 [Arcobacter sp.]
MLNFFNKMKNLKKITKTYNVDTAVKNTIKHNPKNEFPPIKLFISVDQLEVLDKDDNTLERETQSRMFLNKKEFRYVDNSAYTDFEYEFEEFFIKLGNEEGTCPYCHKDCSSLAQEETKCLSCSKDFFKTKRPQDGKSVLLKIEDKELMSLQWENIKDPDLVERMNLKELDLVRKELETDGREKYSIYDAHFDIVKDYTPKALLSGRFRLYSSLIYYLAEHDRYERKFAQALTYYFYVYYLQFNGASNSVVFEDKVRVNERIITRIASLLNMINIKAVDCKDIFEYSVRKATVFEKEKLPYSISQAYMHFVNTHIEKKTSVSSVEEEQIKKKNFFLI